METESFGLRLMRLRKAARLSQRKLAAAIGMDNSTISLAESGQVWVDQLPSYDILRRLARALGVPVEVLADGEEAVAEQAGAPAPAPDGVRDKLDEAIVADLLGELRQVAPRETLDALREMRETEPTAFYRYAVRELVAAMKANMRYGGKMLRLRWNGRETDIPMPE